MTFILFVFSISWTEAEAYKLGQEDSTLGRAGLGSVGGNRSIFDCLLGIPLNIRVCVTIKFIECVNADILSYRNGLRGGLNYNIAGFIIPYMYITTHRIENAMLPRFAHEIFASRQGKIRVRHIVVLSFLPCILETSVLANLISQNGEQTEVNRLASHGNAATSLLPMVLAMIAKIQ
jgi:hypothetical protein